MVRTGRRHRVFLSVKKKTAGKKKKNLGADRIPPCFPNSFSCNKHSSDANLWLLPSLSFNLPSSHSRGNPSEPLVLGLSDAFFLFPLGPESTCLTPRVDLTTAFPSFLPETLCESTQNSAECLATAAVDPTAAATEAAVVVTVVIVVIAVIVAATATASEAVATAEGKLLRLLLVLDLRRLKS